MKKRLLGLAGILVLLLVALIAPAKAQADSLPFSVRPVMPASQRNKAAGYFDVVVARGQSAKMQVQLSNATTQPVVVNVSVNAAQTNDNGVVDYSGSQKRDQTLAVDLATQLKGPKKVVIPAKRTYTYTATLTMPNTELNGVLAGGLVFSPVVNATSKTSGKIAIANRYRYVVAFVARDQNRTWPPKLRIDKAQIRQDDHRNTIAIPLHNVAATFLNQLRVESSAVNRDSGKRYHRTASAMQMAPNSHFFYRLGLPTSAKAGHYRVKTTAYYVADKTGPYRAADGSRYAYRQTKTSTVVLTAAKAKQMQNAIHDAKGGLPWFIIALIVGLAIMFIIIVLLLVVLFKHRRRDNAQ